MTPHRVLAVAALALLLASAAHAAQPERHVVVVVFDGMRPDFITAETTPNVWKLSQEGVFFAHHHPVYLSATEVNGTAIATGAYPGRSGVIANVDFRPLIDPQKSVAIESPLTVRKGDQTTGGHYIAAPTVAELLQARGLRTVIAGTKQVALLHDRSLRPDGAPSPVLFEGETLPASLAQALARDNGPFPEIGPQGDKIARDAWTTSAVLDSLWKEGVPAYTLIWLAEPDFTQHATGPGSAPSLASIRASDADLGRVVAELERRGLRDSTDVFVVSDHGFSTVGAKVDVASELSLAGFHAARASLGGLKPGDVMVVGNGGSSLIYVGGHDREVCRRVAAYLQVQDWTGVVLSREPLEGTFPLREAHIDAPAAPDLVVSLRWTRDKSPNGTPGLITADMAPGAKKVGQHVSLCPYDMHNTLVGAGPDLRKGVVDTLPSGNTDLAPTILWILGLRDAAASMDGRVLGEALATDGPPIKGYNLQRLEAHRDTAGGRWSQYLQVSEVNGVRYLDEGNGSFSPTPR